MIYASCTLLGRGFTYADGELQHYKCELPIELSVGWHGSKVSFYSYFTPTYWTLDRYRCATCRGIQLGPFRFHLYTRTN